MGMGVWVDGNGVGDDHDEVLETALNGDGSYTLIRAWIFVRHCCEFLVCFLELVFDRLIDLIGMFTVDISWFDTGCYQPTRSFDEV